MKRQQELDRKRILDEMRKDAIDKKIMEKEEEEEEDRITKEWARHQERKAELKKEIEEKWKQESLKIRTLIGETIHKHNVDATLKEKDIKEEQERKANEKVMQVCCLF